MKKSKKVTILYSKNQVNEAWKLLLEQEKTDEKKKKSFDILNNWRSAHAYPINTFQAFLRSKIKKFRYSAVVVERLKRVHSIIGKLRRNPKMMLSRIQDIGGLRVVLREVDYVYKLRDALLQGKFKHRLIREDDYIRKPKNSWYRSLHLVYKYYNQYSPEYNGLQIEIQIRTELQHIRATAVETMGIILQEALKSGEGSQDRKNFFALVGSIFAIKEWCIPLQIHQGKEISTLKSLLKEYENKLHVIDKLKNYSAAIKLIDSRLSKKKNRYDHYLLILNLQENTIIVNWYKSWELEKATLDYSTWEQKFQNEADGQVVLVSWESLKILSDAYPNFFWDTKEFVKLLENSIN